MRDQVEQILSFSFSLSPPPLEKTPLFPFGGFHSSSVCSHSQVPWKSCSHSHFPHAPLSLIPTLAFATPIPNISQHTIFNLVLNMNPWQNLIPVNNAFAQALFSSGLWEERFSFSAVSLSLSALLVLILQTVFCFIQYTNTGGGGRAGSPSLRSFHHHLMVHCSHFFLTLINSKSHQTLLPQAQYTQFWIHDHFPSSFSSSWCAFFGGRQLHR